MLNKLVFRGGFLPDLNALDDVTWIPDGLLDGPLDGPKGRCLDFSRLVGCQLCSSVLGRWHCSLPET